MQFTKTKHISVLILTSTAPTGFPTPTPTPIPGDAQAGRAGDPPRAPLGKMKCSLSRSGGKKLPAVKSLKPISHPPDTASGLYAPTVLSGV